MEKAFEKKVFDQIDAKINSEIVSKVDGAVTKLQSAQSSVEIKAKRKDIKLDNVEDAAKKYEITDEEKAAIATVVKEKIKTEKYKSVEDVQKNKGKIIESYIVASQGKVSAEEAAVQVEVFMNSVQQDTLKGRAKSAISTGLKAKTDPDSNVDKVDQKVNIIQQMRQGITASTRSTVNPETIAEQNRVVENLLSKMSETYRMNADTAASYGKKTGNPVDYKQYVKVQGSSSYQTAKKATKTGRSTAHLSMGEDPGVYGPLVGLEKIVKNM